jgi:hypothetical protein
MDVDQLKKITIVGGVLGGACSTLQPPSPRRLQTLLTKSKLFFSPRLPISTTAQRLA